MRYTLFTLPKDVDPSHCVTEGETDQGLGDLASKMLMKTVVEAEVGIPTEDRRVMCSTTFRRGSAFCTSPKAILARVRWDNGTITTEPVKNLRLITSESVPEIVRPTN